MRQQRKKRDRNSDDSDSSSDDDSTQIVSLDRRTKKNPLVQSTGNFSGVKKRQRDDGNSDDEDEPKFHWQRHSNRPKLLRVSNPETWAPQR